MKRLALFCSLALAFVAPLRAAGSGDPYEDLAEKLSQTAGKKLTDKKIAVLTFEYIDKRPSPGGRTVSEKLTNRFVELGELTVIERGMVEKVMKELEFQNTGTVDPDSAKKLGKGLGVEAIVTGTIEDMSYGNVEVNARVIKTETYEIIAAATMKVKKTWSDEPSQSAAPQQQAYEAPAVQQRSSSPMGGHGFLDLELGESNATMNYSITGSFGSGSVSGLTTGSSGLFGMRVGGFGELLGGDFEFSAFNHGNQQQRVSVNGLNFNAYGGMMPQDFLHVNTFEMSGDLLMRFPTGDKIVPYFGLGMGLSINNVQSNSSGTYLVMTTPFTGPRLNTTVPGFLFRVPFGVRVKVADPLDVFLEGRIWMNTFTFSQGFNGLTDTITEQGFQVLGGVGLKF